MEMWKSMGRNGMVDGGGRCEMAYVTRGRRRSDDEETRGKRKSWMILNI